ncbi:DUF317 domain-containing protein [Streptomyces sp. bgisy034]|uniref:DUF317 domain-containing protein n=1 Tax=Streptomyces sp. bgisy034 TaxID=3413774 RepID=UPI003EB78EA2
MAAARSRLAECVHDRPAHGPGQPRRPAPGRPRPPGGLDLDPARHHPRWAGMGSAARRSPSRRVRHRARGHHAAARLPPPPRCPRPAARGRLERGGRGPRAHGRVTRRPGPFTEEAALSPTRGPWHAACMFDGYRWWTAVFSTHTPPGVVAAFAQSLASDDPLPRMAIGTPLYGCGPYTRLSQTSFGYDDEQAPLEARIADACGHRLPGVPAAAPTPAASRTRLTRTR